jgi:hypothetical protein
VRTIKYSFIYILFISSLFSAVFNAHGWEYEKRITYKEASSAGKKNICAVRYVDGEAVIFLLEDDVFSVVVYNETSHNSRQQVVAEVSLHTKPVVYIDKNAAYVLFHKRGRVHLKRITLGTLKVADIWTYPYKAAADFSLFPAADALFVFLPEIRQSKKTFSLFEIKKSGNSFKRAKDFMHVHENWKGVFFPGIHEYKNSIILTCVIREYDVQKENLIDSIYIQELKRMQDVDPFKFVRINTSSLINYPPAFIMIKEKPYILYSGSKNAYFNISIYDVNESIEHTLTGPYVNAHSPNITVSDESFDLYYLSRQNGRDVLCYQNITYRALARYFKTSGRKEILVLTKQGDINSYAIAMLKGQDRIIFTDVLHSGLYMTKRDTSVDVPAVVSYMKEHNGKVFPYFFIESTPDPAGMLGYAYQIDTVPDTRPDIINMSDGDDSIGTQDLPVGKYYLHIAAVDKLNNVSPVVHLPFSVTVKSNTYSKNPENENKDPNSALIVVTGDAVREAGTSARIENVRNADAVRVYYEHIKKAVHHIDKNDYFSARKYLNLAALIDPDRIDHFILIEKNNSLQVNYLLTERILVVTLVGVILIMSFLFLFIRLNKQ